MAVYLQFDSVARKNAYISKGGVWVPNDRYPNSGIGPYQPNADEVQTPSRYSVYYPELNFPNNKKTLTFLQHCKERPENLTYSVELCMVTIPSSALVPRYDSTGTLTGYTSILNEPYIYVRMMPIDNAEGLLITSNNRNADGATFIAWIDRTQLGSNNSPPATFNRPNDPFSADPLTTLWVVYKSCMITTMRLKLDTEQWQIRIYDRYGNDLILSEADNGGAGYSLTSPPPAVDPNLQTSLVVGIRPNYA